MSTAIPAAESPSVVKKPATLPLKHLTYRASVNGAFARVRCVQQFANDALHPVEAVYCFPVPDDACVVGCTMVIGERRITAELKEKETAAREYREAVDAGHHGALLEQERPNIFTMNVGGIEPGEKLEVEVDYVQRIPWQAGGGRFTLPLVVAPRFIPGVPTGSQGQGWSPDTDEVPDASRITPPVAPEGVSYHADVTLMFGPGFNCEVSSPSHPSVIVSRTVKASDNPTEIATGNITCDRDVVLVYASQSPVPEAAFHYCENAQEYFFQVTLLPPGNISTVASDVVLLVDVSGSMQGSKLEGLKRIIKLVMRKSEAAELKHTFTIVTYSNSARLVVRAEEAAQKSEACIDNLQAEGGTYLGRAITDVYKEVIPTLNSERPKVILVVGDGQSEDRHYTGKGACIITVSIDSAVNDEFLKKIAHENQGTCEFVYPGEDYDALANRLLGHLSGPVVTDLKAEPARADVVGLSNVYAGRPAVISLRFERLRFPHGFEPCTISGKDPQGKTVTWEMNTLKGKECDYLPQIWAREYIRTHDDKEQQLKASLAYGVACKHTSFVAVSMKEVPGQQPEKVVIPVNLPAGWDFDAVFGSAFIGSIVPAGLRRCKGGMVLGCTPILRCSADDDEDLEVAMAGGNTLDSCDDMICEFTETAIDFTDAELSAAVSLPSSTRFTFDSPNLPDRVVALFIAQGKPEFDARRAEILQLLTVDAIQAMAEEERAKTYYFAAQLAFYGVKFEDEVMKVLRVEPQGTLALGWYNLARRQEGLPYDRVIPAGGDGADYIASQYNSATLCSPDWLLVP